MDLSWTFETESETEALACVLAPDCVTLLEVDIDVSSNCPLLFPEFGYLSVGRVEAHAGSNLTAVDGAALYSVSVGAAPEPEALGLPSDCVWAIEPD